jgi:hypothetical protein
MIEMHSDRTDATGVKLVTIGRIVVTGTGTGQVDARYLAWMQAAVSARRFADTVPVAGSHFELCRCRLETEFSSGIGAELAIRVEILPLEPLADRTAGPLGDALDRVEQWVETALAVLIENTSVGEPEADLPARIEIRFEDNPAEGLARSVARASPAEDQR